MQKCVSSNWLTITIHILRISQRKRVKSTRRSGAKKATEAVVDVPVDEESVEETKAVESVEQEERKKLQL